MKYYSSINNGYKRVYYPSHPNSDSNGLIYEHQIVASEILGKPLQKNYYIHHKDGNKLNNAKENLLIFNSNKDHTVFHSYKDQCILEEIEPNVWIVKNKEEL